MEINQEYIKRKVYFLLGLRTFSQMDTIEYVDWAIELLVDGLDTKNLRILAGLSNSYSGERIVYFNRVLDDFNIQITEDINEISKCYALEIADNVISGKLSPYYSYELIMKMIRFCDYPSYYIHFF